MTMMEEKEEEDTHHQHHDGQSSTRRRSDLMDSSLLRSGVGLSDTSNKTEKNNNNRTRARPRFHGYQTFVPPDLKSASSSSFPSFSSSSPSSPLSRRRNSLLRNETSNAENDSIIDNIQSTIVVTTTNDIDDVSEVSPMINNRTLMYSMDTMDTYNYNDSAARHDDEEDDDSDDEEIRRQQSRRRRRRMTGPRSQLLLSCKTCMAIALFPLFVFVYTALLRTMDDVDNNDVLDSSLHNNNNNNNNYYDYIIVGGGPAGILVATKLAKAFSNLNVLLLESGTDSQSSVLQVQQQEQPQVQYQQQQVQQLNRLDIPLLWSGVASSISRRQRFLEQDKDDDEYYYYYDSSSLSQSWPIDKALLARGLGGCGLVNAMLYVRALPRDFDQHNLSGWNYEKDLLPAYVQLERYMQNEEEDGDDDDEGKKTHASSSLFRGTHGPITTVQAGSAALPSVDAVARLFVEAATTHVGFPRLSSFNTQQRRLGVGYYEFNIRHGVRDSVARALLGNMKNNDTDDAQHQQETTTSSSRPVNLQIVTGATVTRVLVEKKGEGSTNRNGGETSITIRVLGVEAIVTTMTTNRVQQFLLPPDNDDDSRSSRCRVYGGAAEVILAAGAILTPQILFNSGIGPDGPVANLTGVGKNLQDHPVVAMAFQLNTTAIDGDAGSTSIYTVGNEMEDYLLAVAELERLEQLESSRLSSTTGTKNQTSRYTDNNNINSRKRKWTNRLGAFGTAGFSAGAFLQSPFAGNDEDDDRPDIQLTVFPRHIEPHANRQQQRHQDQAQVVALRSHAMLITVALLQPQARYQVFPGNSTSSSRSIADPSSSQQQREIMANQGLLHDNNPLMANPGIVFQHLGLPTIGLPPDKTEYLSELDVRRLAWGVEQVRQILKAPPLLDNTNGEIYPGASVTGDAALHAYIRQNHLPNSHWVGTTKMGKKDDVDAVVDEQLRVFGVPNLRIVNAGVIPTVPNGNTHSTVCVVASRAADLIVDARKRLLEGEEEVETT